MKKLLSELSEDKAAKIVELKAADTKLECRFYELGLIVGQSVKVLKKTSKGRALLICIRGYCLAVDKQTADLVVVDE